MLRQLSLAAVMAGSALGYEQIFNFNNKIQRENRTMDEIYKAALAEGDTVTVWIGGDEKHQQDYFKQAFEKKFPGLTMNLTVQTSKYLDLQVDQQLANNNVYTDSVILQSTQDYPRWALEGALLNYAPDGYDQILQEFRGDSAAWYGVFVFFWSAGWDTKKLPNITAPTSWSDFTKPEFKDKLILTYPNDDDAILFSWYQILQQNGEEFLDKILAQNPKWVRGTQTPATLISRANDTHAAFFPGFGGFSQNGDFNYTHPDPYVTWGQYGAILKDAPHPEGAKLVHNFILSQEWQSSNGLYPVRKDVPTPKGYPVLEDSKGTNPTIFAQFNADRALVERMRFYFEWKIGPPQGLAPTDDDITPQS